MKYDPSEGDIQSLREWLNKIPYLPNDLDDHFLATFYRSSKGSLERTKKAIDKFFESRLKYPEIMTGLNPLDPEMQREFNTITTVPLPIQTKDGCTIVASCFTDNKLDNYNPYNSMKACTIAYTHLLMDKKMAQGKVIAIADFKNVKLEHITAVTPAFVYKSAYCIMNSFPWRIKGVHGVNVPQAAEWAITLAKSVLKTKITERIHLHGKVDDLLDYYPKEILPRNFGGDLESVDVLFEKYRKEVESQASRLIENERKLREFDALRPKTTDDIVVGSFRNLQVD